MDEIKFVRDKYEFTSASAVMLMKNDGSDRIGLIELLLNDFSLYGVLVRDLVNYPLKEKERNLCLNIAYYVMENSEFHQVLLDKRILNIKKLARKTRMKLDYISKWKDYIIAYWVILSNPDYKFIQDYLRIRINDKLHETIYNKEKLYRGIVIKNVLHNRAYILTSRGEFKKVRLNESVAAGHICEGKKQHSKYLFKIPMCIFLILSLAIAVKTYSKYTTASSIIVIETTSVIKLHANTFDRVIYAYSPTDKGKKLIGSMEMQNKDIDDVVYNILDYGLKNEMVTKDRTIYITVTGQNLVYGQLIKTSKFASDNEIAIIINNGGVEQKLIKEEKKSK